MVLTLAASSSILVEGVATADAYGFTPCTSVAGDDRPSCVFEHGITGTGLRISEEFAEVEAPFRTVCNSRIDFQYSDVSGRIYKTDRSPTVRSGCTIIERRWVRPGNVRAGKACALLYTNADLVATQCHNVFP